MGEFGIRQSVQKLTENFQKLLFYETYFEESNINHKPLNWSKYKIITNLDKKNGRVWILA